MGTYTKSSFNRAARPRSERLRQVGGAIVSTSAAVVGGGAYAPSGETHSHANLADLNMITVTDGYVYLTDTYTDDLTGDQVTETVKVKAGYADKAGANADGYTLDWFIPVTVDGSLTLKLNPIYTGLWADGWGAFGGIGSSGGGGGSTVTVTQILTAGTSIATITVDGVATTLYAPANGGGGSTVAWGTVSGSTVPLTVDGTTKTLLMDGALTNYATQSYVTSQGYITSSALTGYATQSWVGQQGFLTASSLNGYATESWVTQRGYATQTWVGLQGFLTSETDPTVPSWAKASSKPSYSLSEISGTADLRVIEALTGTGLLKRTGTNTWTLDSTSYLSSHQTIYALTLSAGSFSAGTYTPNSAAASFSIPTTLDHISDGSTRKLANYLPLSGGTMTGAITMSGANILTAADSTNQIGSVTNRFGNGYFRNLYTTYFGFRDDSDGGKQWGHLGCGDGYFAVYLEDGQGSAYGQYVFNSSYGFFHGGDGSVPCGRSDHRWSYLYGVNADLTGDLGIAGSITPASDITSNLGSTSRRFHSACVVNHYTRNIFFKDQTTGYTDAVIYGGNGYLRFRTGANVETSYKDIIFHESYGLYPENGSSVNLGYYSNQDNRFRWTCVYAVNADFSGTVTVNGVNTIDQSHNDMALFNYGARASKSFNAYGNSVNLRVHNAQGTQVGQLAVTSYGILVDGTLRPNDTTGLNLGGSSANQRWANIYGVNADLTGDLSLAAASHIDIGPLRIEYDATNKALHITKVSSSDTNTYGIYADGQVAAGGASASA